MGNNVNIISAFSFIAGNNVPFHLRKDEQQTDVVDQPEQPLDMVEDATNEVDETEEKCEAKPCMYRPLIKRILVVGVLALAIGLLCRQRHSESNED